MRWVVLGLGLLLVVYGLQLAPLEGHRISGNGEGLIVVGALVVAVVIYRIVQDWRHR